MEEKHYTPLELHEKWGYSVGTIRKLIKHEPGVLKLQGPGAFAGKRSYTTYSIPESVANLIYQRLGQNTLQTKLPRRNPRSVVFLRDRNRRVA
jgi:hypothetical protein